MFHSVLRCLKQHFFLNKLNQRNDLSGKWVNEKKTDRENETKIKRNKISSHFKMFSFTKTFLYTKIKICALKKCYEKRKVSNIEGEKKQHRKVNLMVNRLAIWFWFKKFFLMLNLSMVVKALNDPKMWLKWAIQKNNW